MTDEMLLDGYTDDVVNSTNKWLDDGARAVVGIEQDGDCGLIEEDDLYYTSYPNG